MTESQRACERDPLAYANRAMEKDFDPYLAVRNMLAKLNAAVRKGDE